MLELGLCVFFLFIQLHFIIREFVHRLANLIVNSVNTSIGVSVNRITLFITALNYSSGIRYLFCFVFAKIACSIMLRLLCNGASMHKWIDSRNYHQWKWSTNFECAEVVTLSHNVPINQGAQRMGISRISMWIFCFFFFS